jgi:hypothetical protein
LHEAWTLSQLSLIEEWSILILLNVVSESSGCKGSPDIDLNHDLFEVVIDREQESGSWLLLVQGLETNRMLFKAPNKTTSSTWKM